MRDGVLVIVYTRGVTGYAENPSDETTTVTQYGCQLYKDHRTLADCFGYFTEEECWHTIKYCLDEERRKSGCPGLNDDD